MNSESRRFSLGIWTLVSKRLDELGIAEPMLTASDTGN